MAVAKTSSRRLKAAERRAVVLQLRKAGYPYSRIAEQVGISPGQACKIAAAAIAEYRAQAHGDTADLVAWQIARLDDLLMSITAKAKGGNLGAIDRILKIEERRSRLLGLDAPSKIAPTNPDGSRPYEGGLACLLREGE